MATRRDPLDALHAALFDVMSGPGSTAEHIDAALRSAVRAVTPGRQQKKNLAPLMDAARKAFLRALRRRARR